MNLDTKVKVADTYGCRFYSFQKQKFIHALTEEFEALSMPVQSFSRKRFKLFSVNDYVYGNLKSAKTIFVVPYDTPDKCLWFKNTYYINNGTKNQSSSMFQTFGPILIFYLLFVVLLYVLPMYFPGIEAQIFFTSICFVLMALILTSLTKGFPNRKNYNRNSSAIITAIELAKSLSKEDLKKTAFAFTDANKSIYMGDMILKDELSFLNRNPLVVHLNCLGEGDCIQIGYTPTNRKLANELGKQYKGEATLEIIELKDENRQNYALAHYKKAVQVCAGFKNDKGYLVNHNTQSNKDHQLDEKLVDSMIEMLKRYIMNVK